MAAITLDLGDLQIALQADTAQPISVYAAPLLKHAYRLEGSPVSLLHPFDETLFYRHGWHSWSLSAWLPMWQNLPKPQPELRWPMIDHPSLLAFYPFSSSGVGALQAPGGGILLLGALELDGFVRADENTMVGAYWNTFPSRRAERPSDARVVEAPADPSTTSGGFVRRAEPVEALSWFLAYGDEEEVFRAYAGLLGERFGRRGEGRPPRVWCSWYSLYREIDEQLLGSILPGLHGLPFDVFQVDDGWQTGLGDWQANSRFPSGMPALAAKIAGHGFRPGLWLAPLAVAPGSQLFKQQPDWLVHTADGRPVVAGHNWGDVYYGLDVTHPAAQEWLAGLIRQVIDWGYTYLKLDFLYAAALPGYRYAALSGDEAFRNGLEVVRQAAGDAYILACGAPALASLGLADALRVGPDVAPYWDNDDRSALLHDLSGPGTLNAIRTTQHRLWLRPLIHVDPDVVFFRSRYNLLTPSQKQTLQDLAQVAGFLATSDPPAWLDEAEQAQVVAFLQAQPETSRLGRYRFQLDGRTVDFDFLEKAWPV